MEFLVALCVFLILCIQYTVHKDTIAAKCPEVVYIVEGCNIVMFFVGLLSIVGFIMHLISR